MGRKRTRLELSAAQQGSIRKLVRGTGDAREQERLRFALHAATGPHTLEDLATLAGRSRSTIQNWLAKFNAGGLEGLLERDTPPGSVSPIARTEIQCQLKAGLRAGRWKTANEVARWLKQRHGIQRKRKSIYYWIAQCFRRWKDGSGQPALRGCGNEPKSPITLLPGSTNSHSGRSKH